MKTTILFLLSMIPVMATAALYGWFESCANMIEMLLLPFTPAGKTAGGALAFGGPFLVLFIALSAGVFIAAPLVASIIAASLGGWGLRQSRRSVSTRSALLTVALAASCTIAFVLVAGQSDDWIPDRPANRPKTPAAVLACVAGGNAALSSFAATLVLRRITSKRKPPPIIPQACLPPVT
jgi:hypothetical protein